MNILDILEVHTVKRPWSEASRMRCKCGEVVTAEAESQLYALHRAHVAQVLEQHMQEAKAEAWQQGYEARQAEERAEFEQIAFGSEREPFPELLRITNPYKESE